MKCLPQLFLVFLFTTVIDSKPGVSINQVLQVKKECCDDGCWYDGEYLKEGDYKEVHVDASKCLVIICNDGNITKIITTCPDCPPDPSNTSPSIYGSVKPIEIIELDLDIDRGISIFTVRVARVSPGCDLLIIDPTGNVTNNRTNIILATFTKLNPAVGTWKIVFNTNCNVHVITDGDKNNRLPVYIKPTANRVCHWNHWNHKKIDLLVDNTILFFTVRVFRTIGDGKAPKCDLTITDPRGTVTDNITNYFNPVNIFQGFPISGTWKIVVKSIGGIGSPFDNCNVEVKTGSTIQLEYGFTLDSNAYDICGTYRQPIAYHDNFLLIKVINPSEIDKLVKVELVYDDGYTQTLTLTQAYGHYGLYRSQAFIPRDYVLNIKVFGLDTAGNPLERILCTTFSPLK